MTRHFTAQQISAARGCVNERLYQTSNPLSDEYILKLFNDTYDAIERGNPDDAIEKLYVCRDADGKECVVFDTLWYGSCWTWTSLFEGTPADDSTFATSVRCGCNSRVGHGWPKGINEDWDKWAQSGITFTDLLFNKDGEREKVEQAGVNLDWLFTQQIGCGFVKGDNCYVANK